jgi:hypothetical protein
MVDSAIPLMMMPVRNTKNSSKLNLRAKLRFLNRPADRSIAFYDFNFNNQTQFESSAFPIAFYKLNSDGFADSYLQHFLQLNALN